MEDGTSWYANVCQYLEQGTIPSHFSIRQKRKFLLKYLTYQSMHRFLYRNHSNGALLRCLEAQESEKVLQDLHERHYRWTHRVLSSSLCIGCMVFNNLIWDQIRIGFYPWTDFCQWRVARSYDSLSIDSSYYLYQSSAKMRRDVEIVHDDRMA